MMRVKPASVPTDFSGLKDLEPATIVLQDDQVVGGRVVDHRRLDRERAGRALGLKVAFVQASFQMLNLLGARDLTFGPEGGLGHVIFKLLAAGQIVRVEVPIDRVRAYDKQGGLKRTDGT
jgi:hypothetical protein